MTNRVENERLREVVSELTRQLNRYRQNGELLSEEEVTRALETIGRNTDAEEVRNRQSLPEGGDARAEPMAEPHAPPSESDRPPEVLP
jgi:hypothetical protein